MFISVQSPEWEWIKFNVLNGTEFYIFIHDEGEEYYFHYDFWPTRPAKYHMKKTDEFLDIMVQKEIKISDKNCMKEDNYSYLGTF